jgi:hypothetical protein
MRSAVESFIVSVVVVVDGRVWLVGIYRIMITLSQDSFLLFSQWMNDSR